MPELILSRAASLATQLHLLLPEEEKRQCAQMHLQEGLKANRDDVKINVWKEFADRVYQPHSAFTLEVDASQPAERLQLKVTKGEALLAHRSRLKVEQVAKVSRVKDSPHNMRLECNFVPKQLYKVVKSKGEPQATSRQDFTAGYKGSGISHKREVLCPFQRQECRSFALSSCGPNTEGAVGHRTFPLGHCWANSEGWHGPSGKFCQSLLLCRRRAYK